jgi:D-arabinose 1-dehydrogenase-like Zn-dependent alcohol dehydrogenase
VTDVRPGDAVFGVVDFRKLGGAAGGVGTVAIQLARARGATVIGTAREVNHDFLTSLGAIPTTYSPGLADRPDGLHRVVKACPVVVSETRVLWVYVLVPETSTEP